MRIWSILRNFPSSSMTSWPDNLWSITISVFNSGKQWNKKLVYLTRKLYISPMRIWSILWGFPLSPMKTSPDQTICGQYQLVSSKAENSGIKMLLYLTGKQEISLMRILSFLRHFSKLSRAPSPEQILCVTDILFRSSTLDDKIVVFENTL